MSFQVVKPIRDEVLVRMNTKKEREGAIFLPYQADEQRLDGVVVRVGPGCEGLVAKGDQVILDKFGGAKVTINGCKEYRIVKEKEILGIIEEEGV